MGQSGEFNEYQFTGSYSVVPSTTNPPSTTAIHINGTTEYVGSWSEIYALSSTKFAMLSGSIANMSGSTVPALTKLTGGFYKIQLVSGDVIAK